jgi:hypothetical protein
MASAIRTGIIVIRDMCSPPPPHSLQSNFYEETDAKWPPRVEFRINPPRSGPDAAMLSR